MIPIPILIPVGIDSESDSDSSVSQKDLIPILIPIPASCDSDSNSVSNKSGFDSDSGIWFQFRNHLQLWSECDPFLAFILPAKYQAQDENNVPSLISIA